MKKLKSRTLPKRVFHGRSSAYRNFSDNMWKTKLLLDVGLSGLTEKLKELDTLLEKVKDAKGTPGPMPRNYEPLIERKELRDKGKVEISMDMRSAWIIRRTLEKSRAKHTALRFHFYSILTVSIWGAFETYLVTLFEELYKRKPEILKSEESLTFRDALDYRENIVELLIEKQLDKIGHLNLKEMLKYLNDKINFNFSVAKQQSLSDYYLIRNIIAHNSGIVQSSIHAKLPNSIVVKGGQLQITKAFLEGMLKNMESNVRDIEKFISAKFYSNKEKTKNV